MRLLLLVCLFCVWGSHQLRADNSRSTGDCDTLITHNGQVIPVSILSETRETVQYYLCGDTSRALYVLPQTMIKRIKRSQQRPPEGAHVDLPEGARPADVWVQEQKTAVNLNIASILGTFVGLFLLVGALFFGATLAVLLAVVLLLGGGICGALLLRLANRNPSLRKFRKRARLTVWLAFSALSLLALILLLLFTLIAILDWE